MFYKSKNSDILLKTIITAVVLMLMAALLQLTFYNKELAQIKKFSEEILEVESRFALKSLEEVKRASISYQQQMSSWKSFNKSAYINIAKSLVSNHADVFAVNFMDSKNIIQYVYPEVENKSALGKDLTKHPDKVVREIFSKALPKEEILFLPPVKIYQGGMALIFYLPVTMRNNSKGMLNILLKTSKIFSKTFVDNQDSELDYGLIDSKTKREYFKVGDFLASDCKNCLTRKVNFLSRELSFVMDLSGEISKLKDKSYKQFGLMCLLVLILTLFLFRYLLEQKKNYLKLISTKDESNLLKILIHDISTPITIIQLALEKSLETGETDKKLLESGLSNVKSIIDVIDEVRGFVSLKQSKEKVHSIDLYKKIKEIESENSILLKDKGLKLDVNEGSFNAVKLDVSSVVLKNHILGNIIVNSVKFAQKNSTVNISFMNNELIIENMAELIRSDVLKSLNSLETVRPGRQSDTCLIGLGIGLFIAKIFCTQYEIGFHISQNTESGVVTTKLKFKE